MSNSIIRKSEGVDSRLRSSQLLNVYSPFSKPTPAAVAVMHRLHGVMQKVVWKMHHGNESRTKEQSALNQEARQRDDAEKTMYLDRENLTVYIQHFTFPAATLLMVPLPQLPGTAQTQHSDRGAAPAGEDASMSIASTLLRNSHASQITFTLTSLWALCRTYPLLQDYVTLCNEFNCDRIGSDRWNDVLQTYCGGTTHIPKADIYVKRKRRLYGVPTVGNDTQAQNKSKHRSSQKETGDPGLELGSSLPQYSGACSSTKRLDVSPSPTWTDKFEGPVKLQKRDPAETMSSAQRQAWVAFVEDGTIPALIEDDWGNTNTNTVARTEHVVKPVLQLQAQFESLFQSAVEVHGALTFTTPITEEIHRPVGKLTRGIVQHALLMMARRLEKEHNDLDSKERGGDADSVNPTFASSNHQPQANSRISKINEEVNARKSQSLSVAPVTVCTGRFYIIVPPAANTPVNMTNVVPFLNDLTFIAPDAECFASRKRHAVIHPDRACGALAGCEFVVLDDIRLLSTPMDWCRVVACFASGTSWQFHNWYPFSADRAGKDLEGGRLSLTTTTIAQIFSMIVPFHVVYDDGRVEDHVRQWAVNILRVSRRKSNSAYKDVLQARQVWEKILTHIRNGNVTLHTEENNTISASELR